MGTRKLQNRKRQRLHNRKQEAASGAAGMESQGFAAHPIDQLPVVNERDDDLQADQTGCEAGISA